MHVITRKRILDFARQHPNSASSLDAWYRIMKHTTIENFAEMKTIFPSADFFKDKIIFNIAGNNISLIASVHFNTQKVYILHILTHSEYDKNKWKEA